MIETLGTVWSIFIIVIGIGMLIFIHELGHFIMAKKHKVRVDAFSLGMGPVLFKWKKGETEYRISLIPLGGYVNMPGELPEKDKPAESFELRGKKPWQRFQIFVAGALMNLIIAFPICILAFLAGKTVSKPIVSIPGTAEAQAGMLPGDEIISIDDKPIEYMQEYTLTIIGKMKDQVATVKVKRGDEIKELQVKQMGSKFHGTAHAGNVIAKVKLGSPAATGTFTKTVTIIRDGKSQQESITLNTGLEKNDVIKAVDDQPVFTLAKLVQVVRDKPSKSGASKQLSFLVHRIEEDGPKTILIQVQLPTKKIYEFPTDYHLIEPIVKSVYEGHPADKNLKSGDRIEEINGKTINSIGDIFDELKRNLGNPLKIKVKRDTKYEQFSLIPTFDELGNRVLGFSFMPSSNVIANVKTDFYKNAGFQKGDILLESPKKQGIIGVNTLFSEFENDDPVNIKIERNGKKIELSVMPQRKEIGDFQALGIEAIRENSFFKKWGILSAVKDSVTETFTMIELTIGAFYKLIVGHESVKDLAGPVGVADISYRFTKIGFGNFLWLLALITVNLGILNLLPIPALDGGHIFLLLIEKVRGKPPGEKFIIAYQLIGICLLVLLIVFATYNDIGRQIGGRF